MTDIDTCWQFIMIIIWITLVYKTAMTTVWPTVSMRMPSLGLTPTRPPGQELSSSCLNLQQEAVILILDSSINWFTHHTALSQLHCCYCGYSRVGVGVVWVPWLGGETQLTVWLYSDCADSGVCSGHFSLCLVFGQQWGTFGYYSGLTEHLQSMMVSVAFLRN